MKGVLIRTCGCLSARWSLTRKRALFSALDFACAGKRNKSLLREHRQKLERQLSDETPSTLMRETATSESPPPRAGTRRVFAVASEKTTSSGSFDVREDRGGKSLPTNRATRQLCPSLLESGLGSIIEDTAVDCSSLTKQRHLTDTAPATGDEADTRSSLSLASALVVRSALESPASEGTPPLDAEAGPTKNRTSSSRRLYGAFCLILLLEVFVNFDSGVVPAVLVSLEREFHFDGSLEGRGCSTERSAIWDCRVTLWELTSFVV